MQLRIEATERVRATAESWLGTPFFPHGTKKGPTGGCSCQTFVAAVYVEAGLLPEGFTIPDGPLNAGYRHIEEFMWTLPQFFLARRPEAGDAMLFKIGRVGHLAICLGDKLIHCLRNRGVHYGRTDDATYLKRLTHVWRPDWNKANWLHEQAKLAGMQLTPVGSPQPAPAIGDRSRITLEPPAIAASLQL